VVQNNQYGISTPFKMQTASNGIAIKSVAYGIQGIQVDGNDYFAMYQALKKSAEYAHSGNGPVLIEAVTYRKGAHTTSDDPTKYRTKAEEEEWDKTDPLNRLKLYLIKHKLYDDSEEEKLISQYKAEIERQFEEVEKRKDYNLDDVFQYMYDEIPPDLSEQKAEHVRFLKHNSL
jgi:pyruvate dehydrogenase E1 component alpha subunit